MPESKASEATWLTDPTLITMSKALEASPTLAELFKLANDPAFKDAVAGLSESDVKTLRTVYQARRDVLDVKVPLETFDGQVIRIVAIDWWHSDRFVDETKGQTGDGVTLHVRQTPDKLVKCLTSSAPVLRFCNRLQELPSESKPVRAFVELIPVRDPARAARGQKMWSIKQMPPERTVSRDGNVPF